MKIKIFQFNQVCVNTYLISDETNEAAIIDCGASYEREYKQLTDYITENNLNLKLLLNTHLHFDHVLGNQFIYEKYGLKPQYNEREDAMPSLMTQSAAFGLSLNYEPVKAEHFIESGDIIRFGNTSLKALLTPGHSPGGLSFYSEENKCVFTGDTLFKYDIGRTDLWGGDEKTLLNAIRTQLISLPDETIVYPGHGPASTIKDEKQNNPYI